jgi:hypothetical protein
MMSSDREKRVDIGLKKDDTGGSTNSLENRINKLHLEKQPERDLWKGIEQAIEQTPAHSDNKIPFFNEPKPFLAIAASLIVITFVGWMSFESGKGLQGENLVAALSEQHHAQKQALLIRFKDQPAMTDNWQQQIDELDEAAIAIKKALSEEPNNQALLKMLKNVYEQQMMIIERVHEPRWKRV